MDAFRPAIFKHVVVVDGAVLVVAGILLVVPKATGEKASAPDSRNSIAEHDNPMRRLILYFGDQFNRPDSARFAFQTKQFRLFFDSLCVASMVLLFLSTETDW
jgi:hypothetical protein